MVIDVGPLLRGEVHKIDIDYMLTPEALFGIDFESDAHVTGSITDNAGYMSLTAEAEIAYASRCARCLEDIFGTFILEFNRTVASSGTLQNEANDEYVIVKNGFLDIDRELVEDLMLEFPSKLLCKEECAGLCPKCGKSLNYGACDCPKKKEIDPRLAILQKLLENDE